MGEVAYIAQHYLENNKVMKDFVRRNFNVYKTRERPNYLPIKRTGKGYRFDRERYRKDVEKEIQERQKLELGNRFIKLINFGSSEAEKWRALKGWGIKEEDLWNQKPFNITGSPREFRDFSKRITGCDIYWGDKPGESQTPEGEDVEKINIRTEHFCEFSSELLDAYDKSSESQKKRPEYTLCADGRTCSMFGIDEKGKIELVARLTRKRKIINGLNELK